MYVRLVPTAKVDHVAVDPVGAEIIREVARRILADETITITIGTEAVRLTREWLRRRVTAGPVVRPPGEGRAVDRAYPQAHFVQ
jgi:hypothetical protein